MEERRIFLELLDRSTREDRAAFLDVACQGDPEMRGRVEALLQRHEALGEASFEDASDNRETSVGVGDTHHDATASVDTAEQDDTDAEADDPTLNTTAVIKKGEQVDQYEIRRRVGRGGTGDVYEAYDTQLDRRVALKFLTGELTSDRTARERFLREARSAAAIDHPQIVTIHSIQEGPLPYIVMEYVSGRTLAERLEAVGSLGLQEILNIALQTAAGLAAAHAQGLIHRDLKPANILLKEGSPGNVESTIVKIADFGLARASDAPQITRAGYVAGTPAYMSPEQAQGQPLDSRSDLFSLGSVMYAMCTGHAPFRGDTLVGVLRSVVDHPAPSLTEVNPEIPESLAGIIEKLMAKSPSERFNSVEEVEAALIRASACTRANEPSSRDATDGRPFPDLKRSSQASNAVQRRWVAIGLVSLLVLLAGFVVKITLPDGTTVEATSPDGTPLQIEVAGTRVEVSEGDSSTKAAPSSASDEPRPESGEADPPSTPDRRATEEILALGGRVVVRTNLEFPFEVRTAVGIPDDPFYVTEVHLAGVRLPVAALSCVLELHFLESIDLQVGNCSAAHLAHLPQLPALRSIGLYHAREIDDDALELISRHKSITKLHLHGAQITNRGLKALAGMRQLIAIWLNDTQIDDTGLPILSGLPNLRMLDLSRTKVSVEGVRSLHQRFPVCHISSSFSTEELALPNSPIGPELIEDPVLRSLVASSDEWEWTVPQPLGHGINSSGDESQPFLSADGLTLWWHGTNEADGSLDLYVSRRESNEAEFGAPEVLPPPINSPELESSPSLTADKLDLFFVSIRDGGRGHMDVWSAHRDSVGDSFGEPVNLGAAINTSGMQLSPCISDDGLLLVYSTQGVARRMRTDLYEARRASRGERFGQGVPLGKLVNSNGSESGSWLSSDGLTLVFRSDRDTGRGRDRLYLTTRANLDDPFHLPLPLIAPINDGDWTGGFTATAEFSTAVIASQRPGGEGGRDLWITRRVLKSE